MFDTEETRSKNVRKFSNIFDIHAGPSWNPHAKPPKMKDNYETVTVEEMGEDGEFSFQLETVFVNLRSSQKYDRWNKWKGDFL